MNTKTFFLIVMGFLMLMLFALSTTMPNLKEKKETSEPFKKPIETAIEKIVPIPDLFTQERMQQVLLIMSGVILLLVFLPTKKE